MDQKTIAIKKIFVTHSCQEQDAAQTQDLLKGGMSKNLWMCFKTVTLTHRALELE